MRTPLPSLDNTPPGTRIQGTNKNSVLVHRVRTTTWRDPSNDWKFASPVLMLRTQCDYTFFRPAVRVVYVIDDSTRVCDSCEAAYQRRRRTQTQEDPT